MPESNAPRSRRVFLAAAAGAAAGIAYRGGIRPNVPSFGKLRIYLNKAVSTSTAVAWTVLG